MPTDSPQKSSDDILQDIVEGNYTKFTSLADFKTILNQILMDIECEDSQNKQNFLKFECGSPEVKNLGTHFFLQSTLGKGLNNIFDLNAEFIILNKDNLSDDIIKKLILLGTHYTTIYEVKINEVNSSFNENDIITTSSFLNFLTSLLNIRNITEFETPRLIHTKGENILPNITFGDSQNIDILIGDTIKLSEDLIHILGFKRCSYEKNLLDFLKSLGNLGFGLKIKEDFQDFSHKVQEIANKTIWSTDLKNLSKEDRELAGYTFLYAFNDKNTDQIKLDCVELLGLEDCPRPATASTRLFQRIAQGNYVNQKPAFKDFEQVESEIKNNIDTLDRAQHIHILYFLKNVLKTNIGSKNAYNFKNLYYFAFRSIDNLSNDLQQKNMLDDSFAQAAESLSYFLFNIVKNNVNNQDLLDQVHIITQYSKLYENIIIQAPHLDSLLDTMGNHLFSIFARNIDSIEALQTGHHEFIKIIKDLNQVCRENPDACNLAKILARSFKSLGSISRKSSGYTLNATREAKTLIESTRSNINPAQLNDAVSFFFKANISQPVLNRKCREIFNLTDCRPANFIDLDNLAYGEIDEMATTLLPEEFLIDADNISTPAPQITVPALVINQTGGQETSTVYSVPVYELPSTTEISADIAQELASRLPSSTEVGATAAHGVGSGLINLMTQATSSWLRNKGYGKSVISGLSLSLASGILQASYVATFPLMLFKLNQLVAESNETEAQAQWDLMTREMLPAFFTSLTLSTGLQLLNYLSENYLSKQSTLKGLIQSIPTLSSLWSFSRNPILTGIHTATAYGVSAVGLFGCNRFIGARNHQNSDVETNAHELQQLNQVHDVKQTNNDATLESKVPEKTHQYICLPELNEVKKLSQGAINQLKTLIATLENDILAQKKQIEITNTPGILNALEKSIKDNSYILEIIKSQFDSAEILHNELESDIHLKACEMYTIKQKREFVGAMEKLGNVFKLMETNFKTLQGELKSAIGYTNAASDSFSNEVNQQLNTLTQAIIFPLSKVTLYKDRYSNADAVEKTEKRCKTEVNKGIFNAIAAANSNHTTSTTLRRNNKVKNNDSRNTIAFYRGSDGDLRISTASSTSSTAESDKSGNSAYNPIDPQQETPLLSGVTCRV